MALETLIVRMKSICGTQNRRRTGRKHLVCAALESLEDRRVLSGSSAVLANGTVTVHGTSGDDSIHVYPDSNNASTLLVAVKSGNDAWKIDRFPAMDVKRIVVSGGNGNDYIRNRTHLPSEIYGGAGADQLIGGSGNDVLVAGPGNDRVWGQGGNDRIWGQDGDDQLIGGAGNDRIWGQGGNDRIWGQDGDDQLNGGDGNDIIYGDAGRDIIWGGNGNDQLVGGTGDDQLIGGTGNDQIWGQAGNDQIWAEQGNDVLYGGDGDDYLNAGTGRDFVFGGSGNNRYQVELTTGFGLLGTLQGFDPNVWAVRDGADARETDFTDVAQRYSWSCFFAASLAAAAKAGMNLKAGIKYLGQSVYKVLLHDPIISNNNLIRWNPARWVEVRFDGSYTDNDLAPDTANKEYWSLLYQRAFEAAFGKITKAGGSSGLALMRITGRANASFGRLDWAHNGIAPRTTDLNSIATMLRQNRAVVAGSKDTGTDKKRLHPGTEIVGNHAYTVHSVDLSRNTITLYNRKRPGKPFLPGSVVLGPVNSGLW
ncbi:MAG: hypothetical protein O2856_14045, partial [Planctomycetota bacterium]|nr:hypothetical protein [Planctomycetota bacterium]